MGLIQRVSRDNEDAAEERAEITCECDRCVLKRTAANPPSRHTSRTRFPSGANDTAASLKCARPNGMPMIVMQ